jgi:phytoene dehydrogenase-like protein
MAEYDGIVIGAGHNGLTCAAYLARAGARVAVLERGDHIGGGTDTSELTAPGFQHNTCANYFHGFDASPVYRDLELGDYGFDFVVPQVQQAYLFSDDRALVIHDEVERTAASVGRFSSRDAGSFRELHARYEAMRGLLVASLYSPPRDVPALAAAAISEGLLRADVAEELNTLRSLRPYDAIDGAFEDEHVRILFKKLIHVIQGTNAPGFGGIFPAMFANLRRTCMAVGGSRSFPEALAAVVKAHGGDVLTNRHVSGIVGEDGRASGVLLDGDDFLEAELFVLSAIDFPQMVNVVGPEHFPEEVRAKAQGWNWTGGHSLVTLHLALNEPPLYNATDFDEDVARAYNISFGVDDTDGLRLAFEEIEAGAFPTRLVGNGACNSLFDPSYAPPGKHVAFWWPFASYSVDGDPGNWESRREEYLRSILDYWRRYAANLNDDNIVAADLWTPLDIARQNLSMRYASVRMGPYTADQIGENRPHPDLADYRVPSVEGLYHCGSTSPNGGGVNGAPGYSAAGVIVDDMGLERWWPTMSVALAQSLAQG